MTVLAVLSPAPERIEAVLDRHTKINPYVHGARGLFSLFVFVFHVVNSGLPTYGVLRAGMLADGLSSLEFGVELFFGISGFVIAETLPTRRSAASFLRDRAIRIFPVLWVTTGIIVLLRTVDPHAPLNLSVLYSFPASLFALPGALPIDIIHPAAWSLSYEMLFYAVCTLALYLARRAGQRWAWVLIAPLAIALGITFPRGIFFGAGVLVARFVDPGLDRWIGWSVAWPRRSTAVGRLHRLISRAADVPGLWLLIFLVSWEAVQRLSSRPIIEYTLLHWLGDRRLLLTAVAFGAALLCFDGLVRGKGLLSSLLTIRAMQWMGTVSYSFYLWHPLVMAGVKRGMLASGVAAHAGTGAQLTFFSLTLPPSLLIAALSQQILERKAKRWLNSGAALTALARLRMTSLARSTSSQPGVGGPPLMPGPPSPASSRS